MTLQQGALDFPVLIHAIKSCAWYYAIPIRERACELCGLSLLASSAIHAIAMIWATDYSTKQVLAKFGLSETYKGQEEATGEDFNVEEVEDGPRPFTALLDTGLKRTSTGSKVFAALKVSALFKTESFWHCMQHRN